MILAVPCGSKCHQGQKSHRAVEEMEKPLSCKLTLNLTYVSTSTEENQLQLHQVAEQSICDLV